MQLFLDLKNALRVTILNLTVISTNFAHAQNIKTLPRHYLNSMKLLHSLPEILTIKSYIEQVSNGKTTANFMDEDELSKINYKGKEYWEIEFSEVYIIGDDMPGHINAYFYIPTKGNDILVRPWYEENPMTLNNWRKTIKLQYSFASK